MKTSDFDYELPEELIAQKPLDKRDDSRLLILDKQSGQIIDRHFYDIVEELTENDVLVVNKTRVINARLKGYISRNKNVGFGDGKLPESQSSISGVFEETKGDDFMEVEIFLHKQISDNTWDCLVYPGKKLKPGTKANFYSPSPSRERELGVILSAKIKSISEAGRIVEFDKGGMDFLNIVEKIGQVPLPPYIKEKLEKADRYQTVFNRISGSVAAPTAGLHFTKELMKKLRDKGVKIEEVLLHVGLGTFLGVESDDIKDHKMHSEFIELEKETAERLNKYKKEGKQIISIGTTSTRVLESFSDEHGQVGHGNMDTSIFIYPGYKRKFVDSLITNFHLPKSTLLMLVSSIAGEENIKKAYEHAVSDKYRFFSFGDAMWIK